MIFAEIQSGIPIPKYSMKTLPVKPSQGGEVYGIPYEGDYAGIPSCEFRLICLNHQGKEGFGTMNLSLRSSL
ncbi:hypothetical protein CSA37_07835 [Candidatus Fermentibacteria bacterium]|nr:MAG: hypothetical protein CSA37_07835 [Candidatus Fermentibacteria bacterium]